MVKLPPVVTLILKRIIISLVLLWAMSLLIFWGTEMLPGDVAQSILGQAATPEALANLRQSLGLNEPAHIRYLEWITAFVQGDFGVSLTGGKDINSLIGERLENTLLLAAFAALIAVPVAIGLGFVAVLYRGKQVDKLLSVTALGVSSFPEYFLAYVLIMLFSIFLGWLPSDAIVYSGMPWIDRLVPMILPCLTLALLIQAHMMRMTRAALISVVSSPFVETARLKGLSESRILFRHILPNAISPIITVISLNIAYLIVGVVVIEVVFVYPGLGQLLVDHVSKRDLPVIQVIGLIFAATYIGLNLIADVLSFVSNPRLLHPK